MTDEVVVQDELATLKQQADVMGIEYPKTVTKTALKLIAENYLLKMPVMLMQLSKNLKLKTSDWCV